MQTADIWNRPVEYVRGVGPKRAELLRKELNVSTAGDLLTFYPFRYVDRSKYLNICEINSDQIHVQIKGRLISVNLVGKPGSERLTALLRDPSGVIELIWFKGIKWIKSSLIPDQEYVVFGKPAWFNGQYNMPHPEMDLYTPARETSADPLQPFYSTTEKLKSAGLDSRGIRKVMKTLVDSILGDIPENLPVSLTGLFSLPGRETALKHIHFPPDPDSLKRAQARLRFEELFFIQLRLLRNRFYRQQHIKGFVFSRIGDHVNRFYREHLPFDLTEAQKRVTREIRADLGSGKQMNRLLQGDVGSGKTMVALMTMLIALDNGYQASLMAPTEILANQHYATITRLLERLEVNIALLTGSTKPAERKKILEALRQGKIQILIGTHALIEESVRFASLGIAVIDEQHRFGVMQRAQMWEKSPNPPHILVMTATPIPRTLAMTLYGDLDLSVIDELPPGRKPVMTYHFEESQRLRVIGFIRQKIREGRQVYIVFPLINESESLDLNYLKDGFESVSRDFPYPDYAVGMVHGQMKPAERDYEMEQFVKGYSQILVATTVIEVGVDVPNASLMVIENAERFGLSQLHQLRGRVGRGADQSFCILLTGQKLTHEGKKRIETMVNTQDGFLVAEADLKLRGPGDFQGTRQSGLIELKIADIVRDEKILKSARQAAMEIMKHDPELRLPENRMLALNLAQLEKDRINLSRIG